MRAIADSKGRVVPVVAGVAARNRAPRARRVVALLPRCEFIRNDDGSNGSRNGFGRGVRVCVDTRCHSDPGETRCSLGSDRCPRRLRCLLSDRP